MKAAIALLALLVVASPAAAQSDKSHWGISGTFIPKWEVPDGFGIMFETEPVDMSGSEFRIGLVRGRDLSGEWGISYVRKTIKDGSTIGEAEQSCDFGACANFGEVYTYNDIKISGVMLHKFIPFGTIKKRVQIGLTVAGGVGKWEGTVNGVSHNAEFIFSSSGGTAIQHEDPISAPAEELFVVKPMPLGDVQVSVAAILAPGLKIRASGGLNFPGTQVFSITATYLFGAK